ncbi:hypothetical protein NDU88_004138, partial [Pleurodeles waltl]
GLHHQALRRRVSREKARVRWCSSIPPGHSPMNGRGRHRLLPHLQHRIQQSLIKWQERLSCSRGRMQYLCQQILLCLCHRQRQ